MDEGGVALLLILGAACVIFGLCMRPLWRRVRRARLRRRETLMLSTARARERWLWVNAFGSIALGAVLIGAAQLGLYDLLRQRAHQDELRRIQVSCSGDKLVLHNRGDAARRVHASDPTLFESDGYRSTRFGASFVDSAPRILQPGQSLEIAIARDEPQACKKPLLVKRLEELGMAVQVTPITA